MSHYADVILPLALPKRCYTYALPADLLDQVQPGMRVEVPFGRNKLYSGLVERIHREKPDYPTKTVLGVLDELSIVNPQQFKLWDWIAHYYASTLGEVMQAALPGHLKLSSETKLVYQESFGVDFSRLSTDEYLIAEALVLQREINVDDARKILNKKTVFPVIQRLLQHGVLALREDLQEKFKPKRVLVVQWAQTTNPTPDYLKQTLAGVARHERQHDLLLAFIDLQRRQPTVRRSELLRKAGNTSDAPLNALVKKGILEVVPSNQSRLGTASSGTAGGLPPLATQQIEAVKAIAGHFEHKNTVLLQGVTGSGKTRVYVELIRDVIQRGGQVLYLMPEIALTTHLTVRLQQMLGGAVMVYHSRVNYNERVELWRAAASGHSVMVSARSGLFLPFRNLQLVVVDEEHDPSYKQYEPSPRYHARDAAIFLAQLYGAKVLLGSATPSLESRHNAETGKYGLVRMIHRFGDTPMPRLSIIDLREEAKNKRMQGVFSAPLLNALKATLANSEQAILFQNRRGYAPVWSCETCGWNAQCINCDVALTYHKQAHRLRCHYCGYQETPPTACPACGSGKLMQLGFGTEKIEDELGIYLPEARVGRMDLDTAGSKVRLAALLHDFEDKQIDILVGTQMVTKGLDFEHVGFVGVIGADQSLRFPDFRAHERTFQLLTQVAGRAGRRRVQGTVLIQAWAPEHPVLQDVLKSDYEGFLARELQERRLFRYPPFFRLIHVGIRHKEEQVAHEAAAWLAKPLRDFLGERVLGPSIPGIPRVRGLYAREMLLKIEKSAPLLEQTKSGLVKLAEEVQKQPGWGAVRVAIDVDP